MRRHVAPTLIGLMVIALPGVAAAEDGTIGDHDTTRETRDRRTERPAEEPVDKPVDRPADRPVDRPVDRPADRSVDQPADRPVDRPADRPVDQPVDQPVDRPADRSVDQPVDRPADRSVDQLVDRPVDVAPDVEVLRLECQPRVTDAGAAVQCTWSEPSSPGAAGIRLWRLNPSTDRHRQVIFRTGDLGVTSFTDTSVRSGQRYAYAVQAVTADGRVVGQSRAEWVRVPPHDHGDRDVEVLRLRCELGDAGEAIGCEWTRPETRDAYVVTLWRSVDGGAREVVERFRPTGPSTYRDAVPAGASKITYAVIATNEAGRIIARSRARTVEIPGTRNVAPEVATP